MKTVPSIVAPGYLPSLDGLRAISIGIVIVSHILRETPYVKYVNGFAGVNIFFVISGFLITTLLLKEKVTAGDISLSRFYTRRVLRIFPVAYLYLFVLIFLNVAFQLHITGMSFASAFLYLKNLSFIRGGDWQSGHFWSLAVEEQFYLIFPFILRYNVKLFTRLIIVLILLAPIGNMLYFHPPGFIANMHISLALQIWMNVLGSGTTSILWGSLCAIGLFQGTLSIRTFEKFKGYGIYLLVLLVCIDNPLLLPFTGKEVLNMYLFAPGVCLVLLLSIQPGKSFSFALLNHPIVRKIGILSYSLYIWQQLFTEHQPWAKTFKYGDSVWLNLIALGITAYLSYHFFEKKFLLLKNRFHSKTTTEVKMAEVPEKPYHSIAL